MSFDLSFGNPSGFNVGFAGDSGFGLGFEETHQITPVDNELLAKFSNEIFSCSGAVTERVPDGTWLKNQLWCNLICATVGYYYNAESNILRLYGLACADQPEGGYSVNWRIAWKDSPNDPIELTIEDSHASTWSGDLDHFKWRLNVNGLVHHLDFRTCHVRYDANGREVDRIYSAQYRYIIENGAVTRQEFATPKQTPELITDVGVFKAIDSIRRTLNYRTLSNPVRRPLVSTEQPVEYQFIIPDSMFEGAEYGLSLVIKAGDGTCYYGPTFDKAEYPDYNDLTNKPTIPTVPTNVSAFTNDAGYLTTETDPTVPSWAKESAKPTYSASEVGALPDSTKYAGAAVAGGIASGTQAIPYGEVDSTSTSTVFTATIPGITELKDGTCVMLRNNVVTSAANFTININQLGAKPVYSSMATGATPTRETTLFNIAYTLLLVYSEDLVEGGAWINYRGYDANTNTIGYQLRTNSSTMPATDKFYRYRILFTSADGKKWVPSNTSTSTNATAKRDVNQRPIDPFGEIVYYGATTAVEANASPSAASLWQEYTFTLGYAFNRTGAALVLTYPSPIYIKCAPQADGSAIIDADDPYVYSLPSTADGKIYIYLGRTYSATAIEMTMNHPVYYHDGTAIRLWTGKAVPELPPLPTTNGNYTLKLVMNNGVPTFSWV